MPQAPEPLINHGTKLCLALVPSLTRREERYYRALGTVSHGGLPGRLRFSCHIHLLISDVDLINTARL